MREKDATRKYRLELGAAMALYIGVLYGSLTIGRSMPEGLGRTLLMLSPAIPLMLSVWAIARHFRRMDEFVRLRSLESLAIAAAVTAGLTFTYGFLEEAGFPKLSMFWVWGVMGGTWAVVTWTRCLVNR
jgi:hypothetical protein